MGLDCGQGGRIAAEFIIARKYMLKTRRAFTVFIASRPCESRQSRMGAMQATLPQKSPTYKLQLPRRNDGC
jgi:hypothetical protein